MGPMGLEPPTGFRNRRKRKSKYFLEILDVVKLTRSIPKIVIHESISRLKVLSVVFNVFIFK